METNKTVVMKESKNKIRVDYEGKLTLKERFLSKVKTSNTWIKAFIGIFRFVLMLGVSYVILYPFFARIAGSFMTKEDIIDATVSLIPRHFTLDTYKYLIIDNRYFEALWNTALLSLLCALIQTFVACLIGYGLAKFKFKGNGVLMGVVILTMVIPHRALKLALANHFTRFDILAVQGWGMKGPIELIFGSTIELYDTFWPLIILSIAGLAFKNGLYIYLMRQFFKGVPDELEESAYVDGSGTLRTFFQIIIPLSIPMMITIFLFSFSWQWTDNFYTTLFFAPGNATSNFWMMPDVYDNIPATFESLERTFAGWVPFKKVIQDTASIMIIAPLLILYLFCQRYLVEGIERSGIVG